MLRCASRYRHTCMDIVHLIQSAVAPVFLLSGVGVTLGVLTNRLARIVDRARCSKASAHQRAARDESTSASLRVLARRAHYINIAIALCTVSALLVSLVVMTLFTSAFVSIDLSARHSHSLRARHDLPHRRLRRVPARGATVGGHAPIRRPPVAGGRCRCSALAALHFSTNTALLRAATRRAALVGWPHGYQHRLCSRARHRSPGGGRSPAVAAAQHSRLGCGLRVHSRHANTAGRVQPISSAAPSFADANRRALTARSPLLFACLAARAVKVGPLVVPFETPCFECHPTRRWDFSLATSNASFCLGAHVATLDPDAPT